MAIYVIRFPNEPEKVKIGYSSNVSKRLKTFQTASPHQIELLWLSPDGTIQEEKALHNYLKKWRLQGEWFDSQVLEKLNLDLFCI